MAVGDDLARPQALEPRIEPPLLASGHLEDLRSGVLPLETAASLDEAEARTEVTPWTVVPGEYGDFLVAIYEEHAAGWVAVEVPGGFSVWVFGKYLKPTSDGGDIYEVTRNAVNIRPRPASDVTNFPMPQRLHAGDRVRLIGQHSSGTRFWLTKEHGWVRVNQYLSGPADASGEYAVDVPVGPSYRIVAAPFGMFVTGDHVHAKSLGDHGDPTANAAQAVDAHCLSCQFDQ